VSKKLLFLIIGLALVGSVCFAQNSRVLEVQYPKIEGLTMPPQTVDTLLPDYIRYTFQIIIFIGAIIAFGVFSYAGIKLVFSAGRPMVRQEAREQISAAILGIAILLSSYLVSRAINPRLVNTAPGIKAAGGITIYSSQNCATGSKDDKKLTLATNILNLEENHEFQASSFRFNSAPHELDIVMFSEANYQGTRIRINGDQDESLSYQQGSGTDPNCHNLPIYENFSTIGDDSANSIKFLWQLSGVYLCDTDYEEEAGGLFCGDLGSTEAQERLLPYDTALLMPGFEKNLGGIKLEQNKKIMGNTTLYADTPFAVSYDQDFAQQCSEKYSGIYGREGDYGVCYLEKYGVILHNDSDWAGACEVITPMEPPEGYEGDDYEEDLLSFTKDLEGANPFTFGFTSEHAFSDLTSTFSITTFSPGKDNQDGGAYLCEEANPISTQEPWCMGPFKYAMGNFEEDSSIFHDVGNANGCLLDEWGDGNGVSSIVINGNFLVILFSEKDFKGSCEAFRYSDSNLIDNRMGSCCQTVGPLGRADCASSAIILPIKGNEGTDNWTPSSSCTNQKPTREPDTQICSTTFDCKEENMGAGGDYCCIYKDKNSDGCYEWISELCDECSPDNEGGDGGGGGGGGDGGVGGGDGGGDENDNRDDNEDEGRNEEDSNDNNQGAGNEDEDEDEDGVGDPNMDPVDLDVTFIERTPRYNRYCLIYQDGIPSHCSGTENQKRWPSVGESVTYTAHIKNKGMVESGVFDYQWMENGVVVANGYESWPLSHGDEITIQYKTTWPSSRGTIEFRVTLRESTSETITFNNSLKIGTHDLTISIWAESGIYNIFNNTLNLAGSYSFEDWIQAQFAKMNERFAQAKYPTSPDGIYDRVRIDKLVVAENLDGGGSLMNSDPHRYFIDGRWQFKDNDSTNVAGSGGMWQDYVNRFAQGIDWGLIHEIGHQLGAIDLYRMNLANDSDNNMRIQVRDINGNIIPASMLPTAGWDQILFERPGIMTGGDTSPYNDGTYYSDHTAAALNTNYGYRRGYFGDYLLDTPANNYIKIVGASGDPISGAEVRLFQKDMHSEIIDNTPEITGTTDNQGKIRLPNRSVSGFTTATGHTLRANPFGQIDVGGPNGTMLVQIFKDGQEDYSWFFIVDLNLAYWAGQTESATFIIKTDL